MASNQTMLRGIILQSITNGKSTSICPFLLHRV